MAPEESQLRLVKVNLFNVNIYKQQYATSVSSCSLYCAVGIVPQGQQLLEWSTAPKTFYCQQKLIGTTEASMFPVIKLLGINPPYFQESAKGGETGAEKGFKYKGKVVEGHDQSHRCSQK